MCIFRRMEEAECGFFPQIDAAIVDRSAFALKFSINEPKYFSQSHVTISGQMPSLGVHLLKDVFLCEGGLILDESRRILFREDIVTPYWKDQLTRRLSGDDDGSLLYRFVNGGGGGSIVDEAELTVSFSNPGCEVYGHWLLDVWPMAHLFRRSKFFSAERYKSAIPKRAPSYGIDILTRNFGIRESSVFRYDDLSQVVRLKTLVVPSMLRVSPIISEEMLNFVNSLVSCQYKGNRKIYLSRSRYSDRRGRVLMNENELCQALDRSGFEVIRPELMSFRQQLDAFGNADVIVGESGSGMHNALFSRSGTKILVLGNSQTNLNQSSIAALKHQSLGYLFGRELRNESGGIEMQQNVDDVRRGLKLL